LHSPLAFARVLAFLKNFTSSRRGVWATPARAGQAPFLGSTGASAEALVLLVSVASDAPASLRHRASRKAAIGAAGTMGKNAAY
jgi:hypothetical protein